MNTTMYAPCTQRRHGALKMRTIFHLLPLFLLELFQVSWAAPLYDVHIYWVSINSYDGGFTTWPVDFRTKVTVAEGSSVMNPTNEFEVKINVDGGSANAMITTHLCCSHVFDASAVVGSGRYGPFTAIQNCRDSSCMFEGTPYVFDHQLQIRVSQGGNTPGSSSAYLPHGEALLVMILRIILSGW